MFLKCYFHPVIIPYHMTSRCLSIPWRLSVIWPCLTYLMSSHRNIIPARLTSGSPSVLFMLLLSSLLPSLSFLLMHIDHFFRAETFIVKWCYLHWTMNRLLSTSLFYYYEIINEWCRKYKYIMTRLFLTQWFYL